MKLTIQDLSEATGEISKIRELVYNPVTRKPQNLKQKGIEGGQIKNSVVWGGHEDHLHVATTDKQIMMNIIDQAAKMGVKSTENPYSKDDPDGKIKTGTHTTGSYHYRNFEGKPLVGKGVDFNADGDEVEVLRKFIEWIHTEYGNPQINTATDLVQKEEEIKINEDISKIQNLMKKIL
jgi:hypothetical protein